MRKQARKKERKRERTKNTRSRTLSSSTCRCNASSSSPLAVLNLNCVSTTPPSATYKQVAQCQSERVPREDRQVGSSSFFFFLLSGGEISQIGEFIYLIFPPRKWKKRKKNQVFCDFKGFLGKFFEIKIIKLATSKSRHFPGRHLQQEFCKHATAHLGQSPFKVN